MLRRLFAMMTVLAFTVFCAEGAIASESHSISKNEKMQVVKKKVNKNKEKAKGKAKTAQKKSQLKKQNPKNQKKQPKKK
jgi:hypothetical protein